jgi:hypothetical protein
MEKTYESEMATDDGSVVERVQLTVRAVVPVGEGKVV